MITFRHSGNFNKTERFFNRARSMNFRAILDRYGNQGVLALSANTPIDTGLTASSWRYSIKLTNSGWSLVWTNSNIQDGVPIAIILQYGHGTGGGGYVQGIDYVNPAMKPVFEELSESLWKEVSSL